MDLKTQKRTLSGECPSLRLAARMEIQLRSRATPAARRSRSKAVPSRRVRGDASVGLRPVASAFGSGLCNSWLDAALASARVARRAACDHEKLTKCSMADHRVLRPARLQIK